jgi:hypothetical protein
MLSGEDRITIHELISLHGHLVDEGNLDELSLVFAPDVIYDLEDFGYGSLTGINSIRDSAIALGDANPVGHHTTNVILSEGENEYTVHATSKYIGIKADGSCGSGTYKDVVEKQDGQWRITYRKVLARLKPLGGK